MKRFKVLLLGQSRNLFKALPLLFQRAGFVVDALTYYDCKIRKNFISNSQHFATRREFITALQKKNFDDYDLIVPFDDGVVKDILDSDLSLEKKLRLLPVKSEKDFKHLSSKIGLMEVLSKNGILVPQSFAVKDASEGLKYADLLGFPLLVKIDFSSGGDGVFECNDINDLKKIIEQNLATPFLIQKKIIGLELDLSGFYQNGKLISFNYSAVLKTIKKFAPSSLRLYKRFSDIDENVIIQMQKIGEVLGVDGFTNVSAIKCQESGMIYIFEADIRPNAWVDAGKFIGNDLAAKIANYFDNPNSWQLQKNLNDQAFPANLKIPNCFRLKMWQILCNRYGVWSFISRDEISWFCWDFSRNSHYILKKLKRLPTEIIRIFLPQKQDRIRIKMGLRRFLFS